MVANDVTEPAVQALIAAINAGDREAFFAALTPDATMSDDGTDRDVAGWADREIFTVHGHLDVVSARDGGRSLIAAYRNDTWGEMRTKLGLHHRRRQDQPFRDRPGQPVTGRPAVSRRGTLPSRVRWLAGRCRGSCPPAS
jgi:hypothetical protein